MDGKVTKSTMLFEIALCAKLVLEHLCEVTHIFCRRRLKSEKNKLRDYRYYCLQQTNIILVSIDTDFLAATGVTAAREMGSQ